MGERTIVELNTKQEIRSAFPVMSQLRTKVKEEEYVDLVWEAREVDRYHLFALYNSGEIVAVIGFKEMTTLYYGRFIWVCDLVTTLSQRSKGYGEELLTFTENWALKQGYSSIALSSGISRERAHKFYEENMDYKRVSYVFKKSFQD
ncbi:Acetyltransferase (GNAT) family protein [Halobacillus karajensis]|uniref:Aminoalkylphosphonic acid N-acetyltransferase n=1 Tax=Halobacillus karajensis TaxID=195088 RepID=A0A024P637_9BACI|nr:GNAT family N-acetyltransferase [Halobacillus karajensis]CDQ17807.1 aminoalkylphosphonic acid N-acetyltransferase [Halobacillus karajensis]CDQ24213.1 aminoalkylphosphonic acid N-acetyltransferase [Halobacillus karajensis]CDQ29538.1 aminoalkylphosphonic acid N-acetyltransferase [Halobacillus karajensis]SEH63485.1 Acetyltransferase (GNAT) family protein [Halobacillus karajensis]